MAAAKFRAEPPKDVTDRVRSPWPSEDVFNLVVQKTWRLVIATGSDCFVTSDSPAFFFEGFGLGHPQSELTIPLCPTLALMADWQGERFGTTVCAVRPKIVREVNRRIISNAERLVFSHRQPPSWLAKVAAKTRPYLSRIGW